MDKSVANRCNKVVDRLWAGNLLHVPRTIWKGALSFGLVNIPVGLYPATSDKSIHFNQFEEGTSDRIRYKKVNERTGEEVANDDIVRGFDLGGGEYVILTDEELESAEPKKSRQIEISDFVSQADIDPVYFRSSYYLAPEGAGADKAYALLRKAMADAGPHRHRHHGHAQQGVPRRHPARGRRVGPAHHVLLRRGAQPRQGAARAARRRRGQRPRAVDGRAADRVDGVATGTPSATTTRTARRSRPSSRRSARATRS